MIEKASNDLIKDLGGNIFSSTITVAILTVVYFVADSRPGGPGEVAVASEAYAEEAVQVLKNMFAS